MPQKTNSSNSKTLQLLFIIGVITMMISQLVYSLVMMGQAPGGTVLSYDWLIWSYGVPALVLVGVYLSRRDRKISVRSVFESLLLTTSWFMILSVVSNWFYQLAFTYEPARELMNQWFYAFTYGAPIAVVIIGLIVTIITLRRKKQW